MWITADTLVLIDEQQHSDDYIHEVNLLARSMVDAAQLLATIVDFPNDANKPL